MWNFSDQQAAILEKAGKYAKIAGVVFIVLGILGVTFPLMMSLVTETFVAWLMLFAGISAAYFTWVSDKSSFVGWLKSFILIAIALFMLMYPLQGVASLGLLMAIYFFMDAFSSFGLTAANYPNKGWGVWLFNALISLALGVLFIVNWPFEAAYLLGLYVGFSLFFDGLALLMGGSFLKSMPKK